MKKILVLTLALVMLLSVSTSASALKVAFSQIGQESDWRTANTDDVKKAIVDAGWELVYDDAQQKQENQVKALRNFITKALTTSCSPPSSPPVGMMSWLKSMTPKSR